MGRGTELTEELQVRPYALLPMSVLVSELETCALPSMSRFPSCECAKARIARRDESERPEEAARLAHVRTKARWAARLHRSVQLCAYPSLTMLKGARTVLKPRRVTTASCAYARSASTASSASRNSRNAVLAASTAVVAGTLWYNVPTIIHNDAPNVLGNVKDALETLEEKIGVKEKDTTDWLSISTDPSSGSLVSLVWGSNKCVLHPPRLRYVSEF